jgi:hypothetical protein
MSPNGRIQSLGRLQDQQLAKGLEMTLTMGLMLITQKITITALPELLRRGLWAGIQLKQPRRQQILLLVQQHLQSTLPSSKRLGSDI